MKRLIVITLSLLLVSIGGAAAGPQRPPRPAGGPGGGPPNDRALAEYVGLSASQKEAWAAIRSETRASVEGLHQQERTLHEQLRTAIDGNDAASAGALMLQIRGIQTQLETARESADAKFAALLTTGQKAKFEAFQAAVEFLRQQGPGGGGPR